MKTTERFFVPFELGEVFRKAREEKGMKQLGLALELDLPQSFISKVERGAYQANKDKLMILCKFLGLDLDSLSQNLIKKELNDEIDVNLQMIAIEHDINLVDPEEALEELRRLEEVRKLSTEGKDIYSAFFYYLRGKHAERKKKWNHALEYYEQSVRTVSMYPELISTNLMAASFNALGRICNRTNHLNQALDYLERGIQSFVVNGERKHIIYHLKVIKAIVLEKMNKDSEALYTIEEIWPEKLNIKNADARLNLTQIKIDLLIKLNRYQEAIDLALNDIQDARMNKLYDRCFEFWSSLGECYSKLNMLPNAELCYQSALKLENKILSQYLTVTTYTQLGLLYLERGAYKIAQSTLEEAVKRGKQYQDDYRLVKALIALGNCFLKQTKEIKALKYIEQALMIARKHSFETLQFDILLELTDICKRNKLPAYEEYLHAFQRSAIQLRKGVGSSMKEKQTLPFITLADPPTED